MNVFEYAGSKHLTYFDPWGLRTLPQYWKDIETVMGPFVVAGGAVYVGSIMFYVGVSATVGLTVAIPTTYGSSVVLIPGSIAVAGSGAYLYAFGTNTYLHHICGWQTSGLLPTLIG